MWVVHNAEDMIDGEWNPMAYPDLGDDINEYYTFTLDTLNNFMLILRTRIKHEKENG